MRNRQMPSNGGCPNVANADRKFHKRLDLTARESISVVSDRGRIARKRKKFVNGAERRHYKALLVAVMKDLISKGQTS